MNKNLVAVAMLAASAFTANVFAADGQINFTGSIIPNPCTVTSPTGGANQTVNLGTIGVTAFPVAGALAGAKSFTLQLTDCPATITAARVSFDGTPALNDNTVLALTNAPDVAQNIGVQITDKTGAVVKLFDRSSEYALSSDGVNNLDFVARYISTSANVQSGSANAVTNFTIVYP